MAEQKAEGGRIARIRASTTFKILVIGFLMLVLLIPAGMVQSLIRERECRQSEVIREISSKWGQAQTIQGPILSVPYRVASRTGDGSGYAVQHSLRILPENLSITGDVRTQLRYRGIYEAVLYTAKARLAGDFVLPDLKELGLSERDLDWSRATISVGLSDMKGINEDIRATLNGAEVVLNPGMETAALQGPGVSARVGLRRAPEKLAFSLDIDLNGSRRFALVPVGRVTTVELSSGWPSPSFDGSFLPAERRVGKDGFTAQWKVLHLNRSYPQFWTDNAYQTDDSVFGVSLVIPTDSYLKSTRTAKYAALFIALTFLAFFISETMRRIRIHPFQYLLIGLALIVFYTLLISISEHLSFGKGYLVASAATIALITGYARSVLRKQSLALLVGSLLTVLYAYLYVLLQLEDYALLLGSIGLFVILGLVMFLTRKVDWYAAGDA
ncbi:MAG: cell envelope integrity protein CreD [Verrucomicrobiota bacterium]